MTPKQAHVNTSVLDRADTRGLTSLLVARHGKLVVERYFNGTRAGDRLPVFSITKSVTSALVGIAIADGRLAGVDEPLYLRRQITLRELLSMTAGFGRDLTFRDDDPATLANRPLVNEPGTTFAYDSGSSDLVAAALRHATGVTEADYARRRLFVRMGIRDVRWPGSHGASGLLLRARELLAFGQLYLDGGVWRGKRIVASSWIRASTREHTPGYGYGWWVDRDAFAARGYLGQALVVMPSLDEVVLVTASGKDPTPLVELVRRASR
jgi:CubicO group peptidase (beta-lactamase class C family)